MPGLPGDIGAPGPRTVPALLDTLADIWADPHPELVVPGAATEKLSVPALRRQITGHLKPEGLNLAWPARAERTGPSHPGDRMKTHLAAAAGSVVLTAAALLGAPGAGAQTATAYPTTPFGITFGAGYLRGTLTWYQRSVAADGTLRAVGCYRARFGAYGASGEELGAWSTGIKCDVTYQFKVVIPTDAPGGAAYVRVCMDDVNASSSTCVRYNRP